MANSQSPQRTTKRMLCESDSDTEGEMKQSHKLPCPSTDINSPSSCSSAKTMIILGNNDKKFDVNVDHLLNSGSPALAALVSDKWREGNQGSIDWSDVDSDIIGLFLGFLNHKSYLLRTTATDVPGEEGWEVASPNLQRNPIYYHVRTFVFADLYLLKDLQNQIVQAVVLELAGKASFKYIIKTARFVYEKGDSFINQKTALHLAVSKSIFDRICLPGCDKEIFSTLIEDYPQVAINMITHIQTMALDTRELRNRIRNNNNILRINPAYGLHRRDSPQVAIICPAPKCGQENRFLAAKYFRGGGTFTCPCGQSL